MTEFVPGLELCRRLYDEEVAPVLAAGFPDLPHGAGLLGRGSDVLGFDDEMSTDHDWSPRVLLFLSEEDLRRHGESVEDVLRRELPATFHEHPVGWSVHSVRGYFLQLLELDVDAEIEARDWLTLSESGLRMATAGGVFHDDVGLQAARDRLAHYPRDVWLYLMMAGWWRVHPEANLAGRAGSVGDHLGSALLGSRLVTDLMRLCFLMEREYAPYAKWFGTAFSRLRCGPDLEPALASVVRADSWQAQEEGLLAAYEKVAAVHNQLGVTEPVVTEHVRMWDRPFRVAWADFPGLLRAEITDADVAAIADRWPTGPVDQLRELLWPRGQRAQLLRLFDPAG